MGMRLSSAKIPSMAGEMVSLLTSAGDIETKSPREVQADLESVLSQYVRDENEVNEKARFFTIGKPTVAPYILRSVPRSARVFWFAVRTIVGSPTELNDGLRPYT